MKAFRHGKGVTLIELMISVVILGVALSAMLGAFVMGRMNATKAKHYIEAMNHAQAAIEQYRATGDDTYDIETGDIANPNLGGGCVILHPVINIGGDNIGGGIDFERVEVTVSWNERSLGGTNPVAVVLVTLVRD